MGHPCNAVSATVQPTVRELWPDVRAVIGIAATVALAGFIAYLFNSRFYFVDDTQNYMFGMWYHLGGELLSGHIPVLNPSAWMSGNYAAEGQWGLWNPLIWVISILAHGAHDAAVFSAQVKVALMCLGGVGTFVLARGYRVSRTWAFFAGVAAPLAGFTVYMDAASWASGLVIWALMPWAWWGIRRTVRAGANPWAGLVACYLVVTTGYVFGLLVVLAFLVALLIDVAWHRRRAEIIRLLMMSVVIGLSSVIVYLPGVLSAAVTWRQGHSVSNSGFMVDNISSLVTAGLPTASTEVAGFWGGITRVPIAYIAWFLPLLVLADWKAARTRLRDIPELMIILVVTTAWVLAPSDIGPLRFPIRLLPYVALSALVLAAVVLSSGSLVLGRRRVMGVGAVVAASTYLSLATDPGHGLVIIGGVAIVAMGLAAVIRVVGHRSWNDRRITGVLFAVAVAMGLAVPLIQHAAAGASALGGGVTEQSTSIAGVRALGRGLTGDVLVVGGAQWAGVVDNSPIANMWYATDLAAANLYTPIGYAAYSDALCMNYQGRTCPELLDRLFVASPTTGLKLVDSLAVNTLQVVVAGPSEDPLVPQGWHEVSRSAGLRTWTRDVPVERAGGIVWSSPGVRISTVATSATSVTFRVDEPTGGDASVVFSRLAWPGYRSTVGIIGDPADKMLLRVGLPSTSAGQLVTVSFAPPGESVGLVALAIAGALAVTWSVWSAVRFRSSRRVLGVRR